MLKYVKCRNAYENSSKNLTLNASTLKGLSYGWYQISREIDGIVILNTFRYSVTTSKQVGIIRAKLEELGVREYLEIKAPRGLQNLQWAKDFHIHERNEILDKVNAKRARKSLEAGRMAMVEAIDTKISMIEALMEAERAHA